MDDQIIDVACRAADKFVNAYYEAMDSNKYTVSQLYGSNGIILWNGNPIASPANITEFLNQLPTSTTRVLSYDSQPVKAQNGFNLLVCVNGVVTYKKSTERKLFHQVFVLNKEETGQCNFKLIRHDTF